MSKKLTFEYVKQYFEDNDCKLLEKEYKNCFTLMEYECNCGNSDCKISFSSFKQGHRCMECSIKRIAEKRKFTFKDVYKYFEDHDCKLLETEYINSVTPMEYECSCGNSDCKISFSSFKQGSRCMECSGSKKYTLEEVKKYFKDHDCKLLATEYINNHTPMKYECTCRNDECKISFKSFQKGRRCAKCGKNEKHTYEYVYNYFKEHDCRLSETEYINCMTSMKYECVCGNSECEIRFNDFKSGGRCMKCAIKKRCRYGENNYNYNFNLTDEEREKNRSRPGCNKWRKLILKRDKNTCQCCFQVERKLIAHHIEDYSNNKELRTVVSNGFLFCEKHHVEFHNIYGYNCNRKQLYEFIEKYQRNIIISIINGVIKIPA